MTLTSLDKLEERKSLTNIGTLGTVSELLRRQSKVLKNVFFSHVLKMTFLGGNLLSHIFDAHQKLPKLESKYAQLVLTKK